jgi:hypothetical protein
MRSVAATPIEITTHKHVAGDGIAGTTTASAATTTTGHLWYCERVQPNLDDGDQLRRATSNWLDFVLAA